MSIPKSYRIYPYTTMACSCRHDGCRAVPFLLSLVGAEGVLYLQWFIQLFMRYLCRSQRGLHEKDARCRRSFLLVAVIASSGCGGVVAEAKREQSDPGHAVRLRRRCLERSGMHCLNPSYDTAVILPPYNTIWAR